MLSSPFTQAYAEFLGFIQILNKAVQGKKVSDDVPASPIIAKLVDLLDKFSGWVDEIPPIEQPQRFGNKAFREWSKRLKDVRMVPQTVPVSFQVLSSSRNVVAITCTI